LILVPSTTHPLPLGFEAWGLVFKQSYILFLQRISEYQASLFLNRCSFQGKLELCLSFSLSPHLAAKEKFNGKAGMLLLPNNSAFVQLHQTFFRGFCFNSHDIAGLQGAAGLRCTESSALRFDIHVIQAQTMLLPSPFF
jgi:hypothetical protein